MSTASVSQAEERLLTAEEYAALSDDRNTELVEGKVVEMPSPGFLHGKVQLRIGRMLDEKNNLGHVEKNNLGHVMTESGVITRRNPDTVRGLMFRSIAMRGFPKHKLPTSTHR